MKIFSGSSNPVLAKKVAKKAKVKLGAVELSRFGNNEVKVWVKEKKAGKKIVVVQSLSMPTGNYLVELGLIADALKRKGAGSIVGVIPYLGYSKQDKVFREGEPLSVKVIAKIIQVFGFDKIITFDLHNLAISGFFDVPLINLSAKSLFLDYFEKKSKKNLVVVAPDAGAVKSSTGFAESLGVDVGFINKKRDLGTGKVMIKGMVGEVKGKEVIIIDDMIVSGETLIESAKFLKKKGAKEITVGATHHLYVEGTQKKLDKSPIDRIIVTDTITQKEKSGNLKVLSVAGTVAKEIGA